jgi:hypothetical protein
MTTNTLIVVLLLAGYVLTFPVLLWGLRDMKQIPGGVWRHAAQRPRAQWKGGMISAYALGGWPVIVSVLVWRNSRERADLREEWAHLSARKRAARRRAREAAEAQRAAGPPQDVIDLREPAPSATPDPGSASPVAREAEPEREGA